MSAFAGVRVLDFSNHFAGAMAAMHLADFGAEVIKVDPTAEERGREKAGYLAWNRNKKRLALDLSSPADLAAAQGLIADTDVAMFDAPLGVLELTHG
jgi:crotonobetainyl-CoA:carnitine CoA-transferase CaiB-like acyl-CoA transferase